MLSGDIERVQEILQSDPSQKDYAVPQEGATPLMYASMSGRYDIASLLIDSGCDIDRQDKVSGWTALMQAVFHGSVQLSSLTNVCCLTSALDVCCPNTVSYLLVISLTGRNSWPSI